MEEIVNRVAESSILTLDLEKFYPRGEIITFDMKDHLFMGLILKEKDFRQALQQTDWEQYRDKNVAVTCTADAVIPVWAYMLVASYLQPVAAEVVFGDSDKLIEAVILRNLSKLDTSGFLDKRVVIKGCGEIRIPDAAYLEATSLLRPFAKKHHVWRTLQYGSNIQEKIIGYLHKKATRLAPNGFFNVVLQGVAANYTLLLPPIRLSKNNTIKIKKMILAIVAAPAAIPVNPNTAAMIAMIRNVTVQRNI